MLVTREEFVLASASFCGCQQSLAFLACGSITLICLLHKAFFLMSPLCLLIFFPYHHWVCGTGPTLLPGVRLQDPGLFAAILGSSLSRGQEVSGLFSPSSLQQSPRPSLQSPDPLQPLLHSGGWHLDWSWNGRAVGVGLSGSLFYFI